VVGGVVVLIGLVSWVLYGIAAGNENRSYRPHGAPPQYFRLVSEHTYWLAVPGGVPSLRAAGVDASKLSCTAAAPGQAPGALQVTSAIANAGDDAKFVNRIGSFVAGFSGSAHIECTGVGAVYVENPAGGEFDWSGLWLVLASAALVVGLPLTLSGLRRPAGHPTGTASVVGISPEAAPPKG
jgi:hypothetical protein